MHDKPKVLRQDRNAIIVSYVAYRIWLAIITYGILAIYDFLSYRNSKLLVHEKSLEIINGAFPSTRTIDFGDISGFSIEQSAIGKKADYGTLKIHSSDGSVISFKFTHDPARVAHILHKKVSLINPNVFTPAEHSERTETAKQESMQATQAARISGTCPRCGGDNLQPITETRTRGVSVAGSSAGCCCLGPIGLLCGLPGAGASTARTRRMCMNCGKKF